jgi:DNA invertase Pin-like site-specific DNA recombinase
MVRRRRRRDGEPRYELGRAAIYLRVSNPGDTREASLETQEAAIAARLRELGYDVDERDVYRDKFTAKETIRRAELNRMREQVRQGVYKAVGVYKLDRLARNMGHSFILLGEMDEMNVRPVSVCEPDIDNSPQGKMYRMMGAYMAEAELANLEDRFGRGREHIAARGLPLSRGVKAYGLVFLKPTRTFALDEDGPDHEGTIKWVRQIFDMAAGGTSAHAIAIHLNALGVPPPGVARGMKYRKRPHKGLWASRVVVNIIRNPAYKGWTIENKFYSEGVTDAGHSIMKRVPEEEWDIIDKTGAITPRVVDDATWDAANATVTANADRHNCPGKQVHDYLLRGMIYCARCGEKRYGYTNRHGTVTYRCANHTLVVQKRRSEAVRCTSRHVRAEWIEPLVWNTLRDAILTPGAIKAAILRSLANRPHDSTEADLAMARANLAEQERIREKFYQKWRDEEARPEPDAELTAKWEADYRAMKGPVESLKKTVATLERRLAATLSPETIARQVEETFAEIRERLERGEEIDPDVKRRALELARTFVKVEGNGRRGEGRAGGSGDVHFYLFDMGNDSGSSPA